MFGKINRAPKDFVVGDDVPISMRRCFVCGESFNPYWGVSNFDMAMGERRRTCNRAECNDASMRWRKWNRRRVRKMSGVSRRMARAGMWPDGTPFDAQERSIRGLPPLREVA